MNTSFLLSLTKNAIGVEISEVIHKRFFFNSEHHCRAPFPGGLPGSLCIPGTMVAYQFYHTAFSLAATYVAALFYLLVALRF
jgi:hypothetical protein